jgi:transposase InsO family protein
MMADVLGIASASLGRWMARKDQEPSPVTKLGRPQVIPTDVQWKIRSRYVESFKQWGPAVLAKWAERQGYGSYSPSTIARVIDDLRDPPEIKPKPRRYEITTPGVMWSEDGTGFKERGKKKELLVLQDECSRFKPNYRLTDGPAKATDVVEYLREAFGKYGAPLVLKHDGGSIFHEEHVNKLLNEYGVVSLTSPPRYPPFNGKKERSFRDVKGFERAMRRRTRSTTLAERLAAAVHDLNDVRPRPILGGNTAREVFENNIAQLPNRKTFTKEVEKAEQRLLTLAGTRREQAAARRKAVEEVLSSYGLFEEIAGVSTNLKAVGVTN